MEWPRVQELIVFATKMGYKKLGMAFCVGLKEEAKVLTQILEKNDFEVENVKGVRSQHLTFTSSDLLIVET